MSDTPVQPDWDAVLAALDLAREIIAEKKKASAAEHAAAQHASAAVATVMATAYKGKLDSLD